jgi:hypothetical protein
LITDLVIVCVTFAVGFWAGKTYQTKDALIQAIKDKLKNF